jgi:hypothetical protein
MPKALIFAIAWIALQVPLGSAVGRWIIRHGAR